MHINFLQRYVLFDKIGVSLAMFESNYNQLLIWLILPQDNFVDADKALSCYIILNKILIKS